MPDSAFELVVAESYPNQASMVAAQASLAARLQRPYLSC